MDIVTFGSCLSRYTANHYAKIFGGRVVSSTYHNRSDVFYQRFVSQELSFSGLSDLLELSSGLDLTKSNADSNVRRILQNQSRQAIGKHRLSAGVQLFDALESCPDLIILDNYMDLAAKLAYPKDSANGGPFFSNVKRMGASIRQVSIG